MANIKISELTEETTPADNDLFELVDVSASSSKKVTRTNLFKNPPISVNGVTHTMLALGIPVQMSSVSYSSSSTGTTVIPQDNTLPQNTEGVEVMSLSITPKSTTNILVIDSIIFCSSSVADWLIAALFQDSTANAIAASSVYQATPTGAVNVHVRHTMVAGTVAATTFKIRLGGEQVGTRTFNGVAGTSRYSTATKSSIVITEYKAS